MSHRGIFVGFLFPKRKNILLSLKFSYKKCFQRDRVLVPKSDSYVIFLALSLLPPHTSRLGSGGCWAGSSLQGEGLGVSVHLSPSGFWFVVGSRNMTGPGTVMGAKSGPVSVTCQYKGYKKYAKHWCRVESHWCASREYLIATTASVTKVQRDQVTTS